MKTNIDRSKIRKMILKEFKMMGMTDMGHGGMKPMGMPSLQNPQSSMEVDMVDMSHDHSPVSSPKSCVTREDCCAAIMCLVECCECPVTKKAIMECCESLLSGRHDS